AALEALPVGVELVHRGIQVNFGCKVCGNPETITHILRDCQFGREVWDLAPLSTHLHMNTILCLDFLSHFPSMVSLPPTGIAATSLPAWLCWNLWTARNHHIFLNTMYTAREVITKALGEAKAWQEAQISLKRPQEPQGMMISFHSMTEERPLQFSTTCRFVSSALAAEAWALREALISAIDEGFDEMQVFSDSQILMNLINSQETHTNILEIVYDIRQLALSFSVILFKYVLRGVNAVADTLAKNALSNLLYHIH
ncbi:hypothetical protein EUTSA_v10001854mg, partial [Eutrema salsugineum]